jgi:hypothetical protein
MLNKRQLFHLGPSQSSKRLTHLNAMEEREKKGSLVHVARTCARSGEGSDHFGSYVCNLSLYFRKGLEPMTSWSQGNSFTAVPGRQAKKPSGGPGNLSHCEFLMHQPCD